MRFSSPFSCTPAESSPSNSETEAGSSFEARHVIYAIVAVVSFTMLCVVILVCLYYRRRRRRPAKATSRPRRAEQHKAYETQIAMTETFHQQTTLGILEGNTATEAETMFKSNSLTIDVDDDKLPTWEEVIESKSEKPPISHFITLPQKQPLSWNESYSNAVRAPQIESFPIEATRPETNLFGTPSANC